MRRVLLLALISLIFVPQVNAVENEKLPNIFVWSTPAMTRSQDVQEDDNADASESDYLSQEEIDALAAKKDAQMLEKQEKILQAKKEKLSRKEKKAQEEAEKFKLVQIKDEDLVSATVLKGYAEYRDDFEAIYLNGYEDDFALKLRNPQTIKVTKLDLKNSNTFTQKDMNFSKYTSDEYRISKDSYNVRAKVNDYFSFGTNYDSSISRSQLEKTADFFAEYRYKKFSVATSYEKYSADMYGGKYYDTLYLAPSFRLNDNVAIKEVVGSSLTTQVKTSELVLQVSPFAHKGDDRLNFELGAKQYFDQTNALYRTRLRFSTMFKL